MLPSTYSRMHMCFSAEKRSEERSEPQRALIETEEGAGFRWTCCELSVLLAYVRPELPHFPQALKCPVYPFQVLKLG